MITRQMITQMLNDYEVKKRQKVAIDKFVNSEDFWRMMARRLAIS